MALAKPRWSELDEDDGDNLDFLLPPKQTIGPDENGIKKIIEYKFNDQGFKVKITTTTRTKKLAEARISKRVLERRSWPKFGDAAAHDDAGDNLTVVSTEDIFIERPGGRLSKPEEVKKPSDSTILRCRTCGRKGEHWTSQCPYRDLVATQPEIDGGSTVPESSRPGKYVPPGGRNPGSRPPRNEENSVRVGNLSEDTMEADLRELFGAFGLVSRVFVSAGKGFGFVNFVNKEDGQRAINKLNGYGYDNLILEVGWAKPRTN